MNQGILRVENLKVFYQTPDGPVKAVNGVNFSLSEGEKLGLVGESGSGKSTMALALMRLIKQPGNIEGGRVILADRDLLQLSDEAMRRVRFAKISLIPQGSMNSLNPVMRIGNLLKDTIQAHSKGLSRVELYDRVCRLLDDVELSSTVAHMYPHELSGGMKQRVCIAASIALQPRVIIADEPTSALDVVVQRQVMETLGNVQKNLDASIILVGHDMGLMAQFVDRLAVMYAGRLVEVGPVRQLFRVPLHPYTRLLIASLPSLEGKGVFKGIPGLPSPLLNPPPGCLFRQRCPWATELCAIETPPLEEERSGRWVACHHLDQVNS